MNMSQFFHSFVQFFLCYVLNASTKPSSHVCNSDSIVCRGKYLQCSILMLLCLPSVFALCVGHGEGQPGRCHVWSGEPAETHREYGRDTWLSAVAHWGGGTRGRYAPCGLLKCFGWSSTETIQFCSPMNCNSICYRVVKPWWLLRWLSAPIL